MCARQRLASLGIALLALFCASVGHAAIPGADNPKAFTEHDYRAQLLEFNRRTTVQVYQQVGKHDPKWDAKVVEFLDGVACHMSNARAELVYRMADPPDPSKLE